MDTLRQNHLTLVHEFDVAKCDLAALRETLHDQVLAQLELELALTKPDMAWVSEWLHDTGSIFRLFRRHRFISPFTLQEIRSIAIWRLHVLRPVLLLHLPTLFHCLPPPVADLYGHPIVFLKLAALQSLSCSINHALLQGVERLRLHLRYIRDHDVHPGSFPLQYLVLVDLDGVSIQNYNLDLYSWILTDIIPRYPGMLAAVFLLNYSWIHAGTWSVAKRVLPASIIARVFFPSKAQLVDYCTAANLPADYGGSLPILDEIDDALRWPYQTDYLPPPVPTPASHDSVVQRDPSTINLSAMSSSNPFFGYPAVASASSPHRIRHVQKGPRELMRTLLVLWWRRWWRWVWTWTGVGAVMLVLVLRIRRARLGAVMRQ